jgi:hypothetical protein
MKEGRKEEYEGRKDGRTRRKEKQEGYQGRKVGKKEENEEGQAPCRPYRRRIHKQAVLGVNNGDKEVGG